MIQAACPNCQKIYKLADTMAGKSVVCRVCQSTFTVPGVDGPATGPQEGQTAPKPVVSKTQAPDAPVTKSAAAKTKSPQAHHATPPTPIAPKPPVPSRPTAATPPAPHAASEENLPRLVEDDERPRAPAANPLGETDDPDSGGIGIAPKPKIAPKSAAYREAEAVANMSTPQITAKQFVVKPRGSGGTPIIVKFLVVLVVATALAGAIKIARPDVWDRLTARFSPQPPPIAEGPSVTLPTTLPGVPRTMPSETVVGTTVPSEPVVVVPAPSTQEAVAVVPTPVAPAPTTVAIVTPPVVAVRIPPSPPPLPGSPEVDPALLDELRQLHATVAVNPMGVRVIATVQPDLIVPKLSSIPGLFDVELNGALSEQSWKNIAGLTQLKALYLQNSKATDANIAQLAGLTKLERVNLSGNIKLTDDALSTLAKLPHLSSLSVSNDFLIDENGISRLKALTGLQILNIDGTAVDNSVLPMLEKMTSLRTLNVGGTAITTGARMRFKEGHPDMHVTP